MAAREPGGRGWFRSDQNYGAVPSVPRHRRHPACTPDRSSSTRRVPHVHARTQIRARENGRLASIPPFSGLSRTSCGTSPSTSSRATCPYRYTIVGYIRVHMYHRVSRKFSVSPGEDTEPIFPRHSPGEIEWPEKSLSLDCNLFPKFPTYATYLLYICYTSRLLKYSGNRDYNIFVQVTV